jgi:xylulokinase
VTLLGLDIGITGCKAVAFTPTGEALAQAYREYRLRQPYPGWMELDPEEVWEAVALVIRQTATAEAVTTRPITALSISTHGESVVPLDARDRPLCGFISAIDTRAAKQARWWAEHVGKERIYRITGMPLHPMYTVNKLMWLRASDPATYDAAHRFVCMADFIIGRLGLPPTLDYTLAARTMAFDVNRLAWSDEILALAQVDVGKLSRLLSPGVVIGEVTASVAQAVGLPPHVCVVTGGHDQPCGALGCGAISEGVSMDSTGTVECVGLASPRLVLRDELLASNLPTAPHTAPGMYLTLGWTATAGALLRWYRDQFARFEQQEAARQGVDVYDLMLAEAEPGPSPVLVLPHFVGSGTPALDAASKGAIVGLDLSTTRGQILKGILEGVSYETRLSLEAMAAAGIVVNELRAYGGGARSPLWLQTKADIFGKPVVAMDVAQAPCLGAAILAGAATGVFASVREGVAQMLRPGRRYEPDAAMHIRYLEKAALYAQLYPALAALNHAF